MQCCAIYIAGWQQVLKKSVLITEQSDLLVFGVLDDVQPGLWNAIVQVWRVWKV